MPNLVCDLCGDAVPAGELAAHLSQHAADTRAVLAAAAARQPQSHAQLQPLNLKAVTYAAHESFYRRHSNPRKCGHYAQQPPCAVCGEPHPCPAVN